MKPKKLILVLLFTILLIVSIQAKQAVSYQPVYWLNGETYYIGQYYSIGNQLELFKNITGMDGFTDHATSGTLGFDLPVIVCNDAGSAKTRIFKTPLFYTGWISLHDNANTTFTDSLDIQVNSSGIDSISLVFMDKNLTHWDILQNSAIVSVDNSIWQQVSNFTSSTQNAHHYVLDRDNGIFYFGGGAAAQLLNSMNILISCYLIPEDSSAGILNTKTSINGAFSYLKSVSVVPSGPDPWNQDSIDIYIADNRQPNFTLYSDMIKVRNADYDIGLSSLTPAISSHRYMSYVDTVEDIYLIGSKNEQNVIGAICDRGPGKNRLLVFNGSAGTPSGYGELSFAGPQTYSGTLSANISNQIFYINESPYETYAKIDSVEVTVNGEVWTQTPDINSCDELAKVYVFDRFQAKVKFGNGIHGYIPDADQALEIKSYVSVDLLEYDSVYAVQHGMPVLRRPRAVAARRNTITEKIDIYVADSARVIKFNLTGSSLLTYRLQYESVFATDTRPLDLDVIRYQKYNTSSADYSEVYIYIVDSLSGIIKVYSDEAALNPLITDPPKLVKTIGTQGTADSIALGCLYRPRTVTVLQGEFGSDKVDVWVSDTSLMGSRIHKFQGVLNEIPLINYLSPAPPVDTSDVYLAPHATFRIFYSITDDNPTRCKLTFYFDPDNSNVNGLLSGNETLIASSVSYSESRSWYDWTMNANLGTYPANGYIFALITDEYGQTNYQYSQHKLYLADDYNTTFSLVDALDGDTRLVVNNQSQDREIAIRLDYADDIVSASVTGIIDITSYRVTSISEGPLFNRFNNGGQVYFNYLPLATINQTGTFEISLALLNSVTGIPRGGVIATMNIAIDSNQIDYYANSNDQRFFITGMLIDTLLSTANNQKTEQSPIDDLSFVHLGILGTMVGDIATDSAYNHGSAPHLKVYPDGRLNGRDVLLFTRGWNGSGGIQDPIADIAPVVYYQGSTAPYIYSKPDGNHNASDIIAFSLMYSWYAANFYPSLNRIESKTTFHKNGMSPDSNFYIDLVYDSAQSIYRLAVKGDGSAPFMMGELELTILGGEENLIAQKAGNLLTAYNSDPLILPAFNGQTCRVAMARLCPSHGEITEEGTLLELDLLPAALNSTEKTRADLEIFDFQGHSVFRQTIEIASHKGAIIHKHPRLHTPYPNPFNSQQTFEFTLPQPQTVTLRVYNLSGQCLATLCNQTLYPSGTHALSWIPSGEIASGTYFYCFETNQQQQFKKILYLK